MKEREWTDNSGRLYLVFTEEQISRGCQSGACDDVVKELVDELKEQLDELSKEDVANALREFAAWSDGELKDDEENRHRLVWIACWDLFEET